MYILRQFFFFLFFILANSANLFAQTQQGIVKTRGRMVNGQVVPGTRLNGATITLNIGNPLVSGKNGAFSFNVPSGKNYSLVAAKKQGYTLADPEYTRHSFKFSAANPFYVVLEDEAQRQADINAATRKVRRTLTAQLQKREDEIEALKEQNKLSEEEYQKRLQELYDNQSKSEQLVKEMAERYASTDYEQLDEFNRQVQLYIEEGELQKADSMIRSKGDMEQRVAEFHSVIEANQTARRQLEQSESGAAKAYADLSNDLLRRSEIFLHAYQQDSALYCLKMRADLDTTNTEALWKYAILCQKQEKYDECEKYYYICLRRYMENNNVQKIAQAQNNLAAIYANQNKYAIGESLFLSALSAKEILYKENPDLYIEDLVTTLTNLVTLYETFQKYTDCERYLNQALDIINGLPVEKALKHQKLLGNIHSRLGSFYHSKHDYANSEKYYKKALEVREKLYKAYPDVYRCDLAITQHNIGLLYNDMHEYIPSEKYYLSALENREALFIQNSDAYRADLASTQNNLGLLYFNCQNYIDSKKYYSLALENRECLYINNSRVYRKDLAQTQYNLGLLFYNMKDYANSETFYKLAYANRKQLFSETPKVYRETLASTSNNMAYLYMKMKSYEEALTMIENAIALLPTETDFYDTKGEILLMQDKEQEALKVWNKVLELDPNFIEENDGGTDFTKALKERGLIE